jgi:hypothetical protein
MPALQYRRRPFRSVSLKHFVWSKPSVIPLNIDDSVTLSDARTFEFGKSVADTLALTDARVYDRGLAVADTVALSDSAATAKTIPKSIDDTLALADARTFAFGKAIADSLALADARTYDRSSLLADSLTLADARAFSFGKLISDPPVPAFVGAGAGTLVTTGTGTVSKTDCKAGNLLLLHVLERGTPADGSRSNRVNITNLAGTTNADTPVTSALAVGGGASSRQALYAARVTADGTCSWDWTVGASGNDLLLRIYEFSDEALGTTYLTVLENDAVGDPPRTSTTGTSTTVADAIVTTNGVGRLALNFVCLESNQAIGAFSGATGGTWAEAVEEYATASGTIQLQIANMASAGVIDGGTLTVTSTPWGVMGTSIISIPNPLSLADVLTPNKGKVVNVDDSITMSDLLSRVMDYGRTQQDGINLADATIDSQGLRLGDTVALSDSLTRVVTMARTLTDSVILADLLTKAEGQLIADALTLADFIDPQETAGATNHSRNIDDTLSLADARAFAQGKSVTDTISVSDLFAKLLAHGVNVNDAVALTDGFFRLATYVRTPADSLVLQDELLTAVARILALADLVALTDDPQLVNGILTTLLDPIATGRIGRGWTGGRAVPSIGELALVVTGTHEEDDEE